MKRFMKITIILAVILQLISNETEINAAVSLNPKVTKYFGLTESRLSSHFNNEYPIQSKSGNIEYCKFNKSTFLFGFKKCDVVNVIQCTVKDLWPKFSNQIISMQALAKKTGSTVVKGKNNTLKHGSYELKVNLNKSKKLTANSIVTVYKKNGFGEYFYKNPIDKALNQKLDRDYTTSGMTDALYTGAEQWKKEINHAYDLLIKYIPSQKKERTNWNKNYKKLLQKELNAFEPSGGSSDIISRADITYTFYRSKARSIYQKVYKHNSKYSYLY